jgi:hypothetical protein
VSAEVLRGIAALAEMLDMIGETGKSDHDLASVFTVYELEIRALVEFSLLELTNYA